MNVTPSLPELHRWLTPALFAFAIFGIAVETVVLARLGVPRDKRSRWLGIRCGALSFGVGAVISSLVLLGAQLWMYQHRLFDLGLGPTTWLLCFVVNDLMFYASHRLQHEVRLLWAVHAVHHSSRHFDLTAGIRGSVLDAVVHFPFYVWIPLLGIHPLIVVIVETGFRFYGLAYHTEAVGRLGVLDRVLVTPSNHRVHHGRNPAYLDKNYGGFFILWDRLLGTWQPETERAEYGLVKPWQGSRLWDCQLHVFRDIVRDVRAASDARGVLRALLAMR